HPGFGAAAPLGTYANWGQRAGGFLIDIIPIAVIYVLVIVIGVVARSSLGLVAIVGLLGWLVVLGYLIWNVVIRQGSTGQTIGKSAMKIKLIKEETGQPVGPGIAFVRWLCHIVDALPLYIGFLAPLWDAKGRTWADNIMGTVVVPATGGGPVQQQYNTQTPAYGTQSPASPPYGQPQQSPYGQPPQPGPGGQNPYGY
ncbi:MAG: RDD family protein, partial [Kutzneria sp.]|nr:RDD family protein [Kutzneria sp.]